MKNGMFSMHATALFLLLHCGCCVNYLHTKMTHDIRYCAIRNITCMYEITCFDGDIMKQYDFSNNGQYNKQCTANVNYNDIDYIQVKLIYKFNGNTELLQSILLNGNLINEITTVLDISENQLYNQPIIPSTNLEKMNLSHNNLSKALLYNFNYELHSLSEIDYSYNVITTMEIDKNQYVFKKLNKIILSNNDILNVPDLIFNSFNDLQYLDLSNNKISIIMSNPFQGISNLNYLNLSFNNIIDIDTSLFSSINLMELNLSNNKISKIVRQNFANLNEVTVLDLSNNFISSLDNDIFDSFSRLENLDLSGNQLQRIDRNLFTSNIHLSNINLSYNNITQLPKNMFHRRNISMFSIQGNNITGSLERGIFEGLDSISDLDLSHQSVTIVGDFSFFGLIGMTKLLLNNNFIYFLSTKSFITLKNLMILDLSYNRITNIDFEKSDIIGLKSLAISNNLVEKINEDHLFFLHRLQYLDLSQNNITRIQSKSFQSLTSLDNFFISKNPLSGTLEEQTFDGLYDVPLLDLSGTSLTLIKNSSFDGMLHMYDLNISHSSVAEVQYNSFSNTENIDTIDLSYNQLENFAVNTSHLKSLKNLQLNNNIIKTLSQSFVKGLLHLNKIVLSHNNLLTLHSDTFQDQKFLNYLDLSFNLNFYVDFSLIRYTNNLNTLILSGTLSNITFKEMKVLPLTKLDISNSNIHNISFISLQKLKDIQIVLLRNNNITQIEFGAFSKLGSVIEIDISYNGIKYIEPGVFKDCHQLHTLNISHNNLSIIRYGVFKGLAQLNILDISYNYISNLETTYFYGLPELSELLVDHNRINKVSVEDFRGLSLRKLSIGENPLPCNSLIELIKYSGPILHVTSIRYIERNDENYNGIGCNYYKHIPNQRVIKSDKQKNNETMSENLLIDIRDILFNISAKNVQSNDKSIINHKYDSENSQSLTKNIMQLNNISLKIENENKNTNQYLERLLKLVAAMNSFRPNVSGLEGKSKNDYTKNEADKLKVEIDNNIVIEREKILADVSDKLSVINQRIDSLIHSTTITPVTEHRIVSKEAKSSAFIEICVVLILIILVCFVLYKVYKSRCYIVSRWTASTRHISEMENSNL